MMTSFICRGFSGLRAWHASKQRDSRPRRGDLVGRQNAIGGVVDVQEPATAPPTLGRAGRAKWGRPLHSATDVDKVVGQREAALY
jgi:hypothetical protein